MYQGTGEPIKRANSPPTPFQKHSGPRSLLADLNVTARNERERDTGECSKTKRMRSDLTG